MENALECVFVGAISFSASFYLARACLSAVVRFIAGVEPPRGMDADVLR
jgi:hypothetical protein